MECPELAFGCAPHDASDDFATRMKALDHGEEHCKLATLGTRESPTRPNAAAVAAEPSTIT